MGQIHEQLREVKSIYSVIEFWIYNNTNSKWDLLIVLQLLYIDGGEIA